MNKKWDKNTKFSKWDNSTKNIECQGCETGFVIHPGITVRVDIRISDGMMTLAF
jgi:hypothetical protein